MDVTVGHVYLSMVVCLFVVTCEVDEWGRE